MSPEQVPGTQTFPRYDRQAPAPSHNPSNPQVTGSLVGQSAGKRGAAPPARLTQVPTAPGDEQVRQPPAHGLEQQTPSTQD